MIVVSALVAVVLLGLAGVHVYWGVGGAWPARTRAELGPMVVGTSARAVMPNLLACVVVAALLLTAAGLVVAAGLGFEGWVVRVGAAGVAAVLGLRGVGGFFDGRLRPGTRGQPFYRLNLRIYSPLCLLLSAAIVAELW